jgi:hypothetical protein
MNGAQEEAQDGNGLWNLSIDAAEAGEPAVVLGELEEGIKSHEALEN